MPGEAPPELKGLTLAFTTLILGLLDLLPVARALTESDGHTDAHDDGYLVISAAITVTPTVTPTTVTPTVALAVTMMVTPPVTQVARRRTPPDEPYRYIRYTGGASADASR